MTIEKSQLSGRFSVKNLFITSKENDSASLFIRPHEENLEIISSKNCKRTCINSNKLYLKSTDSSQLIANKSIVLATNLVSGIDSSGNFNSNKYQITSNNNIKLDSSGIDINSIKNINMVSENININTQNINIDSNKILLDSKQELNISTSTNNSNISIIPHNNGSIMLGSVDKSNNINMSSEILNINTTKINIDSNNNLELDSTKDLNISTSTNNSNISITPHNKGTIILGSIDKSNNIDMSSDILNINTTKINIDSNNNLDLDSTKNLNISTSTNNSNISLIPHNKGSIILGNLENDKIKIKSKEINLSSGNNGITINTHGNYVSKVDENYTLEILKDYKLDVKNSIDINTNQNLSIKGVGKEDGIVFESNLTDNSNGVSDNMGTIIAKCHKFIITGDLDVQGDSTTINTKTTILEDINIQLGSISKQIKNIKKTSTQLLKIKRVEHMDNDHINYKKEIELEETFLEDLNNCHVFIEWNETDDSGIINKSMNYKIQINSGKFIVFSNQLDDEIINAINNTNIDVYINPQRIILNSENFNSNDIKINDYINILTTSNKKLKEIQMKVHDVNIETGDITLDYVSSEKINDNFNDINNEMNSEEKPYINKLKKFEEVHDAGLDIDFFDTIKSKKVTKFVRYQSNNKQKRINTWKINAPIRMEPEDEPNDTDGDGELKPITIGKRPVVDEGIVKGWSIVANNNNLIIRNEDSNNGKGQIVFLARSSGIVN